MRGGTRRSGAHREPRGAQQRGVGDAEGGEKEVVREGRHLRPVVGAEPAPQVRARPGRMLRRGGQTDCATRRLDTLLDVRDLLSRFFEPTYTCTCDLVSGSAQRRW